MKSNFKYIIIFIISSLCIVFLVQLFWLKGLYNTIETETEKNIFECLNIADTYELEYRLDSIENSPEEDRYKGEMSISQSIGSVGNEKKDTSNDNKMVQSKKIVQGEDTIKNTQEEVGDGEFSLSQFEKLGTLIRETIHQTIDSIAPIRLDTLHSALSSEFTAKGIKSKIYKIEVVDFEKDSIIQSLSIMDVGSKPFIFSFTYDSNNQFGYRIYMEPLIQTVLAQMLGILTTTFVIILILAYAFWYLIRTIFQQKTLEEMKEDFTNNMTHELKTPIAVAYSATDALLNFGQGDNKEKREKYLSICKEQLEKLSGLVEQILSLSIERRLKLILKKEDIELKEILNTLAEQHKIKTEKKTLFNLNIQPDNLSIHADKTHLNNVISNLIDNAIKYSYQEVVIDINAYSEDNCYVIKVRDNGIGIPSDKQKYLFDKFYRVPHGNKHNAKGYGIGLFYVKTVIEKHGGTIDVTSSIGKGSEFTIKIPVE